MKINERLGDTGHREESYAAAGCMLFRAVFSNCGLHLVSGSWDEVSESRLAFSKEWKRI